MSRPKWGDREDFFHALNGYAFFGYTTISSWIQVEIDKSTKAKVDKILTEEYIEKEVDKKSKKVIDKLVQEFEQRAKNIVESYFTCDDWIQRGFEFAIAKEYGKAIMCYEKALEKLEIRFSNNEPEKNLNGSTINAFVAELKIMAGDYKGSLDNIARSIAFSSRFTPSDKRSIEAANYFLKTIAEKLLGINYYESENAFRSVMATKRSTDTSFALRVDLDPMSSWLNEADIPEQVKKFIADGINCYKDPARCD